MKHQTKFWIYGMLSVIMSGTIPHNNDVARIIYILMSVLTLIAFIIDLEGKE